MEAKSPSVANLNRYLSLWKRNCLLMGLATGAAEKMNLSLEEGRKSLILEAYRMLFLIPRGRISTLCLHDTVELPCQRYE